MSRCESTTDCRAGKEPVAFRHARVPGFAAATGGRVITPPPPAPRAPAKAGPPSRRSGGRRWTGARPALVDQAVVPPAEQDRVGQAGLAAIGPVLHMVRLGEAARASGIATAAVPFLQRAADVRGDGARPPPHAHHFAVPVTHRDPRGVARHAPRCLRAHPHPVELGAARLAARRPVIRRFGTGDARLGL